MFNTPRSTHLKFPFVWSCATQHKAVIPTPQKTARFSSPFNHASSLHFLCCLTGLLTIRYAVTKPNTITQAISTSVTNQNVSVAFNRISFVSNCVKTNELVRNVTDVGRREMTRKVIVRAPTGRRDASSVTQRDVSDDSDSHQALRNLWQEWKEQLHERPSLRLFTAVEWSSEVRILDSPLSRQHCLTTMWPRLAEGHE